MWFLKPFKSIYRKSLLQQSVYLLWFRHSSLPQEFFFSFSHHHGEKPSSGWSWYKREEQWETDGRKVLVASSDISYKRSWSVTLSCTARKPLPADGLSAPGMALRILPSSHSLVRLSPLDYCNDPLTGLPSSFTHSSSCSLSQNEPVLLLCSCHILAYKPVT